MIAQAGHDEGLAADANQPSFSYEIYQYFFVILKYHTSIFI